MALKITKSIDFTMLIVRVWTAANPLAIMKALTAMIMIKMKSILKTVKSRIMKFIQSLVIGLALVVERDGLIL